ncbi:MAG: response regulator [Bacteroidales bacterium]|nr:response regulator [Bacteroidales bacterium]
MMLLLGRSSDADKPEILIQISDYYQSFNPDRALTYIDDAIEYSQNSNDTETHSKVLLQKSKLLALQGNHVKAAQLFYSAIEKLLDSEEYESLSNAYIQLAELFQQLENYPQSIKYYEQALQYDSILNNDNRILKNSLLYIHILNLNKQYDDAMHLLNKIPSEQIESDNHLFWEYKSLQINTYSSLKRFDHVFAKLEQLLQKAQSNQDKHMTAQIHEILARNYSLIYNYAEAKENYGTASRYFNETGLFLQENNCIDSTASILIIEGDYLKALDLLLTNMQTRTKLNDSINLGNNYYLLAQVYRKLKDNDNVLNYLKLCINSNAKEQFKLEAAQLLSEYYLQQNNSQLANYFENKAQFFRSEMIEKEYKNKFLAADLAMLFNEQENLIKPVIQKKTYYKFLFYISIFLILATLLLAYYAFKSRTKIQIKINDLIRDKNKQVILLEEKIEQFEKQNESLVIQRTEELQSELKHRRSADIELKKALKRAEDANYVKNAFLANMSHEIRTPLNGIIGFASLLEIELSLLENQELYEFANSISESGERLLHLLNNIIDISRIEANDLTISLTQCKVNDIVQNASELFKFKANEKGLRFNVKLEPDLPLIMVDEKSLAKIACDIIDNAVKYTEKGFINIVSGFEEKRNEVFFKIKDTGVGIDEAYLPNVFEAFRQESLGYSRAYQGAGLGLPLAKRFVELMNGRIEIESKKAVGTLISIYFPIKEMRSVGIYDENKPSIEQLIQKEEIIVVSTDKSISDKDPYIFVVEDDRMNRLVIKKMLEKDWRYEIADDGDQTLIMIEEFFKKGIIFDIMLFDINLPPPWDGIKLMHEIKKKYKEYANIPFVAQTAYAMSGDRERLLESGFDDYIPKPINRNILVNSIKNQLKS